MIIKEKIGRIEDIERSRFIIDHVELHWYETGKRIMNKTSQMGDEITFRFLKENPLLTEGDIIYKDEIKIIVVFLIPCSCIILTPENIKEASAIAYEIGNKHLPLFYDINDLLIPFDAPLFNQLISAGYKAHKDERKLHYPLKTSVSPHSENNHRTLLSKILKITAHE